jgi:hypothetical protein
VSYGGFTHIGFPRRTSASPPTLYPSSLQLPLSPLSPSPVTTFPSSSLSCSPLLCVHATEIEIRRPSPPNHTLTTTLAHTRIHGCRYANTHPPTLTRVHVHKLAYEHTNTPTDLATKLNERHPGRQQQWDTGGVLLLSSQRRQATRDPATCTINPSRTNDNRPTKSGLTHTQTHTGNFDLQNTELASSYRVAWV